MANKSFSLSKLGIKSTNRYPIVVVGICLVLSVVLAFVTYRLVKDFISTWTMTALPSLSLSGQTVATQTVPTAEMIPGMTNPQQGSNAQLFQPTPVAWDGSSRVTVLLMGLDYRDWSEGVDVPRTDSMILFSIDPVAKTAAMLSIPRDLWVTIPGMQNNKINTAYRWGEVYKLPDGPTLAMKTVEGVIGVPIQYYVLIDFNSIIQLIDELGGLDMKIKTPIVIDPIGPGNTITLEPGTQTLDGAKVLAYARQRHTQNDDFDRSTRQQEVIMAIRKQMLQFNQVPMMISKAPKLYKRLSKGIRTNLSLDEIIRLANLASQVPDKGITKGVFDPHKDVGYASVMTETDGNQAVLIPNYDQIRILRDKLFATSGAISPSAAGQDLAQVVKTEGAKITVQNGTQGGDLAARAGTYLQSQGINILGVGNASVATSQTQIIDHTGKPYTINFIIQKFQLQNPVIIQKFDLNSQVDLDVILGQDAQVP